MGYDATQTTRRKAWHSLPVPVFAAFAAALVALMLEGFLFQRLVAETRVLAEGVSKARIADTRLDDIEDLLIEAEAGQRGYLLVGRDQYLKPYLHAVEQLGVARERLEKGIDSTPSDRDDFNRIAELLRAKLAEMERTIDVFRRSGREEAIKLLSDDTGQEATDEIRAIISHRRAAIEPVIERGRQAVYASMDQAKTLTGIAAGMSAIILAIVAGIVIRHFANAREKEDLLEQTVDARVAQLAELSGHLLSVRETERARIARELHDELGSCLTLLAQDLVQLRRHAAAGDPVSPDVIASMQDILNNSVQQQRQLIYSLRPPLLESLGLRDALDTLTHQFSANQDIPVLLSIQAPLENLRADARIALYRIVQESLTNIARHAHATRVEVNVSLNNEVLVLTIVDNGRGPPSATDSYAAALGLTGMRERARHLGGTLTVTAGKAGRGTVVEALIPIAFANKLPAEA